MRLFIYSMPLFALAMLLSSYSARLTINEGMRSTVAPRSTAIVQKLRVSKTYSTLPARKVLTAVFTEE